MKTKIILIVLLYFIDTAAARLPKHTISQNSKGILQRSEFKGSKKPNIGRDVLSEGVDIVTLRPPPAFRDLAARLHRQLLGQADRLQQGSIERDHKKQNLNLGSIILIT